MKEDIKIFVDEYEKAVSRLVLFTLSKLPFSLGMKRFISVLKGTKSTFVIDNELHTLPTFSMFSSFTAEYLRSIIDMLKEQQLIEVTNVSTFNNMPVLSLTSKGKEFINRDVDVDVPFVEKGLELEVIKLSDSDQQLFESLRAVRKELALENEVPAYLVCSDQVLREVIFNKPRTIDQLIAVNGIGEKFAEKYGEPFLEVMNSFMVHSE